MKNLIQGMLRPLGYELHDMRKIGRDPWRDLQILLQSVPAPVCFDVGAHRGETLRGLVAKFPQAVIYAFEPDPENFAALQNVARTLPQARLQAMALGDCQQQAKLQKTQYSMCNSLLAADKTLHSTAHQKIGEVDIAVTTLDLFCQEKKIETVDLLKTDCQGFDLRVLHGAKNMLSAGRIKVIQSESLYAPEYEGQGWFYEIQHFLSDLNYVPVSFGEPMRNERHEVIWSDVIFKYRNFKP